MWTCGSNTWSQSNPAAGKKECALHTPSILARDEEVLQIACGYFHTLVLLKSGRVFAFGKVLKPYIKVEVVMSLYYLSYPSLLTLAVR